MGHATFRKVKQGTDPLAVLPPRRGDDARSQRGEGALTVSGTRGPVAPGAVVRRAFCPLRGAPR